MYQQNALSSADWSGPIKALASADAVRRDSSSTVRQLRSIVGELVVALSSRLNDERESAQKSLSRAVELLQTTAESRPTVSAVKGGLAPWQMRKVASHVDTALDKPIRSSDLA